MRYTPTMDQKRPSLMTLLTILTCLKHMQPSSPQARAASMINDMHSQMRQRKVGIHLAKKQKLFYLRHPRSLTLQGGLLATDILVPKTYVRTFRILQLSNSAHH